MKVIGHVSNHFLPTSQTFVYHQIKRNKWFRNIVFTTRRMNRKSFPFRNVIKIVNQSDLIRKIQRFKVDVIHAHFGPNAILSMAAKKRLGIPMLTFFHGFDASKFPRKSKGNLKRYRELFKTGEVFVVPSNAIKQQLISLGCPQRKIFVSHYGIDVEKINYKPRYYNGSVVRLISVGRLVEKKGHQYLIKALATIEDINFHLKIIGEGEERQDLENLIKKYGLEDRVTLLGEKNHSEVLSELEKADIFCLASVTAKSGDMEGLPVSILEAQAMGLPIISTYHSGIPEGVCDGKSALLAEERNVKDLADKLTQMMKAPERWTEFGEVGRQWVEEHFHKDKQARELKKLYKRLLKSK